MNASPLVAMATFYWQLPIVIVLISLVYSATRHDDWGEIFSEALRWGRNMVVFLVGVAAILFVLALWGWGLRLFAVLFGCVALMVVLALWNWGQRLAAYVVGGAAVALVAVALWV